jgi:hypothetical protein
LENFGGYSAFTPGGTWKNQFEADDPSTANLPSRPAKAMMGK